MNKLLKILGGIFLALLIGGGILAAIFVPKWASLDNEVVSYIETNVPLIVDSWSIDELKKRAAPELLNPSSIEQLPKLFSWLSSLGKLKKLEKPVGQVGSGVYPGTNMSGTWANYVANAEFEAGPAQITIVLKRDGETWKIIGFHVDSPVLLPQKS